MTRHSPPDEFEWQVMDHPEPWSDAGVWEDGVARSGRGRWGGVVRSRRLWLGVALAGLGLLLLLGWQLRQREALLRRDLEAVVAQEHLASQTRDQSLFEPLLDPAAPRRWREQQLLWFWSASSPDATRPTVAPRVGALTLQGAVVEAWLHTQQGAFQVLRTFRQEAGTGRWLLSPPDATQWGGSQEASTSHFALRYTARDAAIVAPLLAEIDDFYIQLRHDVGLPPPSEDTPRITITIRPDVAATTWHGTRLDLPSPALVWHEAEGGLVAPLKAQVGLQLTTHVMAERWHEAPPGLLVAPLLGPLAQWQGEAWSGRPSVWRQAWSTQGDPDMTVPGLRINWLYVRNFFLLDYLIVRFGRARLPAFWESLQATNRWEQTTPQVFGLPYREFEQGWQVYLESLGGGSRK